MPTHILSATDRSKLSSRALFLSAPFTTAFNTSAMDKEYFAVMATAKRSLPFRLSTQEDFYEDRSSSGLTPQQLIFLLLLLQVRFVAALCYR